MAWTQTGNLKGPKGDPGSAGEDGIQGIPGEQGVPGDIGPKGDPGVQGPKGDKGDTGADGQGIEVSGTVSSYAELPTTLTVADAGAGYLNTADGQLYLWSGTAFPASGEGAAFRGPRGDVGDSGPVGPKGDTGEQGVQGPEGARGATGLKGDTGTRGTKWFTGVGAPGAIAGMLPGDMYLDTVSGTYYEQS